MYHVSCPEDADRILRNYINKEQLDLIECFWVILLTNANRVLGISEVGRGTTLGVQTNPKYIFQTVLMVNAASIIVAHNHPSGNLAVSSNDVRETKKLRELARLMDITLLDHLIITSESFLSFSKEGKL